MIGVVGATGFTGRLIASELRQKKANFFIAGRNADALNELASSLGGVEQRIVDVKDRSTFGELRDCKVLINCAGPFTDLGELIVQEALKLKAHYLDLTGEQNFIKLVYDNYDRQAREDGVALIPACAFEYAIGDAAAEMFCAEAKSCSSVEIIYDVQGMHTSPGTRKSIVRAMVAPGFHLRSGKLEPSAAGAISKSIVVDRRRLNVMSFPGGESVMLRKHTNLQDVSSFMSTQVPAMLLPLVPLLLPVVGAFADHLVDKKITAKTPSVEERKNTRFAISVISDEFNSRRVVVSGRDPYQLTAVIASAAALRLLLKGPDQYGAISPAMIAGAEMIRDLVTEYGATWTSV